MGGMNLKFKKCAIRFACYKSLKGEREFLSLFEIRLFAKKREWTWIPSKKMIPSYWEDFVILL